MFIKGIATCTCKILCPLTDEFLTTGLICGLVKKRDIEKEKKEKKYREIERQREANKDTRRKRKRERERERGGRRNGDKFFVCLLVFDSMSVKSDYFGTFNDIIKSQR